MFSQIAHMYRREIVLQSNTPSNCSTRRVQLASMLAVCAGFSQMHTGLVIFILLESRNSRADKMDQAGLEPSYSPARTSIAVDIPCCKCGYDLRGLETGSRCPECGTAVSTSLRGDSLFYGDPVWVNRLARGAKLINAGLAVGILGFVLGVVIAFTIGRTVVPPDTIVAIISDLLLAAGSWLFTTRDPGGVGEDWYGPARKITRIMPLIGIIIASAAQFTVAVTSVSVGQSVSLKVQGLQWLIFLCGIVAQLQYIEKLTLRIPAFEISALAKFLKKALSTSVVALLCMKLVVGDRRNVGTVIVCVNVAFTLLLIVSIVLYFGLLWRLSKQLKLCAAYANINWPG
jgi:hypothetical protein